MRHQWAFRIIWIVPLDPSGFKRVLVITIFFCYSKQQMTKYRYVLTKGLNIISQKNVHETSKTGKQRNWQNLVQVWIPLNPNKYY